MSAAESINELASSVVAELLAMAAAPLPECYEVWFLHRKNQNPQLSEEIEERRKAGEAVTTDFLCGLYYKYCGFDHIRSAFDRHYDGIMVEVEGLQSVARGLTNSAASFGSDIRGLSQDVQGLTLSQSELKRFINLLIDATAKATRRNSELEEELSLAVDKIGALKDAVREIENDAYTDFLTKLYNRRRFDALLREALCAADAEDKPLSLIVCDVDHFKSFNDAWGHHVGDQVLKFVASVIQKNTKGQDIVARYGGEEFALALPNTALENACKLAEQIRNAIARRRLVSKATNEDLGSITLSFGIAQHVRGGSGDGLFRKADAALYRAKGEGRNRVAVEGPAARRIA